MTDHKEALLLDTTGLRCPLPVVKMEATLRKMLPGACLKIITDDPIARVDIPHFAQSAGHKIIELKQEMPEGRSICVFLVTCGEKQAKSDALKDVKS